MSLRLRPLGRTGVDVPVVSFGCGPLGGIYSDAFDPDEGIRAVREALRLGVNYFDTAPYYGDGKSEQVLGRALKDVPRSEVIVATKLGRYGADRFDFSAETVHASIRQSLERLQMEYVDIMQCHDIEFGDLDQVVNEMLPALVKAKGEGLIKYIGITGLPLRIYHYVLDRVPEGTVDVILSYCHHTLFDSTLEAEIPYLEGKGVGVINASSLSMGLLSPYGPPAWHPASQDVKDACAAARALCEERGVSLPRISLFNALQSVHFCKEMMRQEVHENIEAAKLTSLSEKEAACLQNVLHILRPVHNKTWLQGRPENN